MGGEIGVRSTPGVGSVFFFSVHLKEDRAVAPQPAPPDFVAARVLVLETYPPAREVIADNFANRGLYCRVVGDSKAMMEALAEGVATDAPYHFAFLDADRPAAVWWPLVQNMAKTTAGRALMVFLSVSPGRNLQPFTLQASRVVAVLSNPLYPSQVFDAMLYVWRNRHALSSIGIVTRATLARTAADAASGGGAKAAPVTRFPGAFILLVEDQAVNQILMKTVLEKAGCDVEIASNGVEAVAKARAKKYDLIFMDCQMPEMDGFEATRRIREDERESDRHVPIVALTADAMQGDKEKCLQSGMDDYVNKPVKVATILAMMERFVRQHAPD
jgi:CheY-like chemotaxis protein